MGRWLLRVVVGFFALLLALSLLSFHPNDPHFFASSSESMGLAPQNLCGLVGAHLAGLMQTMAGIGAWLFPAYCFWEAFPSGGRNGFQRIAWLPFALSIWTALGALGNRTFASSEALASGLWRWGGWMGSALWPPMKTALGPVGLPLLLVGVFLLSLFIIEPPLTKAVGRTLAKTLKKHGIAAWPMVQAVSQRGIRGLWTWMKQPFLTWKKGRFSHAPELESQANQDLDRQTKKHQMEREQQDAFERAQREATAVRRALALEKSLPPIQSMRLNTDALEALEAIQSVCLDITPPGVKIPSLTLPPAEEGNAIIIDADPVHIKGEDLPPPALLRDLPPPEPPKPLLVEPITVQDRFGRIIEQPSLGLHAPTPREPLPDALVIKHPEALLEPPPFHKAGEVADLPPSVMDRTALPPRTLFNPAGPGNAIDAQLLDDTQALIAKKLGEFRVKGQVVGRQPGPVVTVYEFQPDPGVSLAKVMSMEDDLALGLQAEKVRIARIPGKNLVGIEVPNRKREIIAFREIVDSPTFHDPAHKEAQSLLSLALGKDISGGPVVFDLGKMPHLLIGGSTGSGKSVGVNAMICSVLLRALPEEVKLILVDPKMVELGMYEDIPHLWAPVVTDMKEAGRVLKWVVAQMEDRYKRLALLSVRNLESFNAKLQEMGGFMDLSDRTPNPRWPERPSMLEPLPYVVVVIDELADLMMICRQEVEESIARIAQKARAVGIHLVLATQRPSVDIVTGVIKANLPARLSYRVNTKIDSRTILDTGGGEQLLGKGDALFLAPGSPRPNRIHAPLLTEEETLRLVQWLKARGKPEYNQGLLSAMETDEETASAADAEAAGGGEDDIYERAKAVVIRERKASTSLLQRKLNIGYGRAARIIDRMEEEGIVGPDRGAGKPREVYVYEEA